MPFPQLRCPKKNVNKLGDKKDVASVESRTQDLGITV